MFLYEPVEIGLFWVMEEGGTVAHCELFHGASMWVSVWAEEKDLSLQNKTRFVPECQRIYAVVRVETGQKVIVVFVVGILPMINTKRFASPLLYALF